MKWVASDVRCRQHNDYFDSSRVVIAIVLYYILSRFILWLIGVEPFHNYLNLSTKDKTIDILYFLVLLNFKIIQNLCKSKIYM